MKRIWLPLFLAIAAASLPGVGRAEEQAKVIRLGMIGLDTSHVIAFTSYLNNPKNKTGCRVVAGYPGGSPDFPASANRVDKFTKQLRDKYGLEIVDSIEELCKKVDGILLESVDGRPHLKQAKIVIAAGKPLFVGCDVFGSSSWAEHHPSLYLYGIHAVEPLFTVMGTGCETVRRIKTDGVDMAVGVWKGGRIGTFRDLRGGKTDFTTIIYGKKSMATANPAGYAPLLVEIVKFFKTGKPPVPAEETIEIFAFMSAADESQAQGGKPVSLERLIAKAREEVNERTAKSARKQ
ncbi:MAG: gfo/Idh/MocA family oxidoreductase [Planctomycetes bacterium]|nr:gfo/Idh/MocA family oxidoreductase [Planctomycetota bacterium]